MLDPKKYYLFYFYFFACKVKKEKRSRPPITKGKKETKNVMYLPN